MNRRFHVLRLTSAALLMGLGACDIAIPGGLLDGLVPDGKSDSTIGKDFDTATPLGFDSSGRASVNGTIVAGIVHVYDLGPCSPGDRLRISILPAGGSSLDPTAAIFDATGELFSLNDDVDLEAGRLDSSIDAIVRTASDHYYLGVTRSYFGVSSGAYTGTVQINRGGEVPTPPEQILLLDFAGGSVTIPNVGSYVLSPFDAALIDPAYAGHTSRIKERIVETVRSNFRNTGLRVITTDDGTLPPEDTYSTLYFGEYNNLSFGISQQVDHWNGDICDDGIVYINRFDDPFAVQPTADGIGIAIGNVAAHEAGHLLGLEHVADVTDLMDSTGTASTLLANQEFKTSSLHESVFPFGVQNGPTLLTQVMAP